MLKIRNLNQIQGAKGVIYSMEYECENSGVWKQVVYYANSNEYEVIDAEPDEWSLKHLKEAVEKALRLNTTETFVMWY